MHTVAIRYQTWVESFSWDRNLYLGSVCKINVSFLQFVGVFTHAICQHKCKLRSQQEHALSEATDKGK